MMNVLIQLVHGFSVAMKTSVPTADPCDIKRSHLYRCHRYVQRLHGFSLADRVRGLIVDPPDAWLLLVLPYVASVVPWAPIGQFH
jgi:hypothetical protein